jgi:hypothetical protein
MANICVGWEVAAGSSSKSIAERAEPRSGKDGISAAPYWQPETRQQKASGTNRRNHHHIVRGCGSAH